MFEKMPDYQSLSIEERLQIVEDIWDSIAVDADQLPVSPAQKRELDKRLERLVREGSDGIDARAFVSDLKSRL